MTPALRTLALDAVANAEWSFGDRGERATVTLPAEVVARLVRLAGFLSVDDAEQAVTKS
jgi:hypothetical protein